MELVPPGLHHVSFSEPLSISRVVFLRLQTPGSLGTVVWLFGVLLPYIVLLLPARKTQSKTTHNNIRKTKQKKQQENKQTRTIKNTTNTKHNNNNNNQIRKRIRKQIRKQSSTNKPGFSSTESHIVSTHSGRTTFSVSGFSRLALCRCFFLFEVHFFWGCGHCWLDYITYGCVADNIPFVSMPNCADSYITRFLVMLRHDTIV